MSEFGRIADQLQRGYEGEAWHGANLRTLLEGVSAERGAARPVAGAHSIWEIVQHISVWTDVVRRRLAGERLASLPDDQDWAPVRSTTPAAWSATLAELDASHRRLLQAIAGLDDARLNDTVPEKDYSVYVMLHGLVQHVSYHGGQIGVLKRALESAA